MAIELSGLAARLKAGIDKAAAEKEAERRRAAEEAQRREAARQETLQAQLEMLQALDAFADSVGYFTTRKGKLWVQMVLDGKGLRFTAIRNEEAPTDHILVEPAKGTDTEVAAGHYLTRDELGEWEVVLKEEVGPRRLPVELGLEELFAGVLAIAPPEPKIEPASAPEPASRREPTAQTPPRPDRPKRKNQEPAAPPGSGLRPLKGPFG